MNNNLYLFTTAVCIMCLPLHFAHAANSPAFASQYGQIQNVQNYSSNPFYSPGAKYNQAMPTPVSVTGPDVGTGDCTTAVSAIITSFCSRHNKCADMTISDIHPNVILELSRLPGHNYATSCIGYIDSEYTKYKKSTQYANVNQPTNFPTAAAVPNPNANGNTFRPQMPQRAIPEWQQELVENKQELKELQAQNGPGYVELTRTEFPKTYQDVSFADRMQIESQGYEPYKDATPYSGLKIDEESFRPKPKPEPQQTQATTTTTKPINQEFLTKILQALQQTKKTTN